MVELFIIRHAEAEGNLYRRLHGHYDGKLTRNGRRQVEALKTALCGVAFDACYSSDLTRTMHTAAAVGNIDIVPTPAFREIAMGDWEDITMGDAYAIDPGFEQSFLTPDLARPGGETMREVYNRTSSALLSAVERHDGSTIAVVSHTCAIRAILACLIHGGIDRVGELPFVTNSSITRFRYENGKFCQVCINDAAHAAHLPMRFPAPVPYAERPFLRFYSAKNDDEIDTVVSLWREAWIAVNGFASGFNYSYAYSEMERMHRNHPEALRLAYLDGTLAGALVLDTANLQEDDCGHISLFVMKERYRGYGLGFQLLGEAVAFYRELGRQFLRLRVDKGNAKALRFYESNDFFVSGLDDAGDYIMKKTL